MLSEKFKTGFSVVFYYGNRLVGEGLLYEGENVHDVWMRCERQRVFLSPAGFYYPFDTFVILRAGHKRGEPVSLYRKGEEYKTVKFEVSLV